MLTKPKQIILDKSALQGTKLDQLQCFAKDHCLLICEPLLYECATSSVFKDRQLLSRCRALIQDGAYYCSRGEDLIRYEGQHLRPFPWLLADIEKTARIRSGPVESDDAFSEEQIAAKQDLGFEFAKVFLLDPVRELIDSAGDGHSEVPDFRGLPKDIFARLAGFAKSIDGVSFRNPAITRVPKDWIRDDKKYCLSSEWMAWQFFRLLDIVLREYLYLHQGGGSLGGKRAEHDYQDLGYVLLLCRADGILTKDKSLVEPLARAAFPEKDVFSSLEEVPDSYRCDWACP
jgi:hypothetical protein